MWLPMSCYLTLPTLKSEISNFAGGVKKKNDDAVVFIDDLHLQSNLNIDVLDYLRMWSKNKGHYNVKSKSFDSLSSLKTLMTFDLKYGLQSMKDLKNIDISQNRYTYYCHSVYIPPMTRSRVRSILSRIVDYRLDLMHGHPLSDLQGEIVQSIMSIDEYFRKNVGKLKYSQFSNPNTIITKKLLIETVLTRALDREEVIDTPKLTAEVMLSLTNQFYLMRVMDPVTKSQMYKDINDMLVSQFRLDLTELGDNGLQSKDIENLQKVVKVQEKQKKAKGESSSEIMSMHSLDECRRLLEQIE